MSKTIVVFRKTKDGEVIALFPRIPGDMNGSCLSYAHFGQHSAADYHYTLSITIPALHDEYKALKEELEAAPYKYDFDVRKRIKHKVHSERLKEVLASE